MPSTGSHARPDHLPAEFDSWRHTIITPARTSGIRYPDGRRGIICTLQDGTILTVILSERSATTIGRQFRADLDGPTIMAQQSLPGL